MKSSPDFRYRKGLLAGVATGAAAGLMTFGLAVHAQEGKAPVNSRPAAAVASPNGMPSFADIVQNVAPAVVSIDVSGTMKNNPAVRQEEGDDDSSGDALPFPFNLPGMPGMPKQNSAPRKIEGTGSGFFISQDGYIVTNNHVVEDADKITVRTNDDRTLPAKLIGRDEATDLAVIKVDVKNANYVSFQNQAKPRVGDWVIAVGNPFNFGGTATAGIVSALHRSQPGSNYVDFMQIDAPINRGNSGGPTFDVHGRVVGVNTAIFSPSGGSVGIGFDIPADVAEQVTRTLISSGKVTRGYIGAQVQDASTDMAESVGLGQRKAAIVVETTPGGPSEKAGLKPGDIVLKVGGSDITSATDLTRAVGMAKAGDTIRMDVWRDGRRQSVDVRSGTRPSEAELASNGAGPGGGAATPGGATGPAVLGMRLAAGDNGVTVQSVASDSNAADKGIQKGDVIVSAGQRPVGKVDDIAAVVTEARKAGRNNVLLLVERDGRKIYVPVEIAPDKGQG